jgi:monovalent cation:H+ antiporter-2, CPA2 family
MTNNYLALNIPLAAVGGIESMPILINITAALVAAFIGGIIARWLKLPPLVGYLVAGVAIGPFTPGYVGDISTISQLAELGVIFLLFGVGLHFSLRDLWAVRRIAIPGAILQMGLATGLALLLTSLWGWSLAAGLVIGLAVSIASTVVLLRNLMDQGLLNTSHGRIAVGWLVLEDLATVLILVLLPAFFSTSSDPLWQTAGLALLKAAAFAVLMLVVGTRVLPWFLVRMAHLHSRELFIISVVVVTLGTAVGAAWLFGVSLALGAFLAGVVVSESSLSHQVEAEVLPFRETFAVLFFVSVGMLVNPLNFISQAGEVFALTALVVVGKSVLTVLIALVLAKELKTALIVAVSLSQIGEFSFLLGQAGVGLGILSQNQYSLLLTAALFSITVNTFLFKSIPFLERFLSRLPILSRLATQPQVSVVPVPPTLSRHVVVVGYGRVGQHLVNILDQLKVQSLVIEADAGLVAELTAQKVPTLLGDAADSEILSHAHLNEARAVIVTLPDELAAASVVATVRDAVETVPLIARASSHEGVRRFLEMGCSSVIYPELEGSLEIMEQTLLYLGYPLDLIQQYKEAVRRDYYDLSVSTPAERQAIARLLHAE